MLTFVLKCGDEITLHENVMIVKNKAGEKEYDYLFFNPIIGGKHRDRIEITYSSPETRAKKSGSMESFEAPLALYEKIRDEFLSWPGAKKRYFDDLIMNKFAADENPNWVSQPIE